MLDLQFLAKLHDENAESARLKVREFSIQGRAFNFNLAPSIMGVINLSPDSWYRESVVLSVEAAIARAKVLHAQGADMVDVERVVKQPPDRFDIVPDRRYREMRAVKRCRRITWRRRLAITEQFGRHEEILRRVERLVRPDQPLVAMRVGHVMRRQKDNIVVCGVEPAVGRVHDTRLGQHNPAFEFEVVDDEGVSLAIDRSARRE